MTSLIHHVRPASLADLPLVRQWLATPEVSQWWDAEDPFDASDLEDPSFSAWIVELAGAPFACLQDYAVHAWEGHPFGHLPPGSRGIDQFIGRAEMIGKGHGSAFIRQHVAALFASGVPTVATDPHPRNARAIAAYRKAGFRIGGEPVQTEWGVILPMEAHPVPASPADNLDWR
jgi:aminoglycoside 6'-N-acetyltransferase